MDQDKEIRDFNDYLDGVVWDWPNVRGKWTKKYEVVKCYELIEPI